MNAEPFIAGVELGGTKCIATIARGRTIVRQARWATAGPDTLDRIADALQDWRSDCSFAAIGVASFGPIGLNANRPSFGKIGNTPKPGWAGVDVHGYFETRFSMPIGLDTDVGGAALAEWRWGASVGCAVHGYATIGTGVGLGLVVDGKALHGHLHPEAGHMRIRRSSIEDYAGACPTHGDCLEGLVGGPALANRAGRPLADVPDDDPLWTCVSNELAEWSAMLILSLSLERLVMGGGLLDARPALLAGIRSRTSELLNGYLDDLDADELAALIVPPALGRDAGPLGSIYLGERALTIGKA